MSHWIETELKFLLPDEDAFRRVQAALGPARATQQVNHFLDCEDGALRRARIGVRLRSEGGNRLLTVKSDALDTSHDALSQRIELERSLSSETFEAALTQGLDLLPWLEHFEAEMATEGPTPPALRPFLARLMALCRDQKLRRRAGFTNFRQAARATLCDERGAFDVELLLDETRLPGDRIDYELEVELGAADEPPARVERALRAWLRDQGVTRIVPASSKFGRLQEQLAQLDAPASR